MFNQITMTIDTDQIDDTFFPVRFKVPGSRSYQYHGLSVSERDAEHPSASFYPQSSMIHNGPRTAHDATLHVRHGDVICVTVESSKTPRGMVPRELYFMAEEGDAWESKTELKLVGYRPAHAPRRGAELPVTKLSLLNQETDR